MEILKVGATMVIKTTDYDAARAHGEEAGYQLASADFQYNGGSGDGSATDWLLIFTR